MEVKKSGKQRKMVEGSTGEMKETGRKEKKGNRAEGDENLMK